MGTEYDTILVDHATPVATVTLNQPDQLNAWSWQMSYELGHAFNQLDADDDVRAIVVTGAGKAFCAGMTLAGGGSTFAGNARSTREELAERFPAPKRTQELATPVIAAINGHAVGAGLTMTMHWDLRIAAEEAKLGFVFNRRGIIPDADLMWLVPRMIGFSRAYELLLTGRTFRGTEAAELGLVSRAVPAEQVLDEALALGHEIATNVAPVSAAITKRLAFAFLDEPDHKAAARLQGRLFGWSGRQADAKEGVTAFLEKRDPEWQLSKTDDLPEELPDL